MASSKYFPLAFIFPLALSGCGLTVPQKDLLSQDTTDELDRSSEGKYESNLIGHINCEIKRGLLKVWNSQMRDSLPWLFTQAQDKKGNVVDGWGTAVYLQLQVDEQSQFNPGVGVYAPMHNAYAVAAGPNTLPLTPAALASPTIAAIPQYFNIGIGVGGSAHSTRLETIQYVKRNAVLLSDVKGKSADDLSCESLPELHSHILIESDLKIDEFIYDKATIAYMANTNEQIRWPPFNTFQETITFSVSYNGGVTPTWKFTRVTANPNSPTVSAERSEVNTLIITLGEVDFTAKNKPTSYRPEVLAGSAATQHAAAAQAALIGSANRALSP